MKPKKFLLLVTPDPAASELDFMELYEVGFTLYWARNFDHAGVLLRNQQIDLLLVDATLDTEAAFAFCREARTSKASIKIGLLVEDRMPPADLAVDVVIVGERVDHKAIAELKKQNEIE
jgi:DNA-binding response OmpR family regulator